MTRPGKGDFPAPCQRFTQYRDACPDPPRLSPRSPLQASGQLDRMSSFSLIFLKAHLEDLSKLENSRNSGEKHTPTHTAPEGPRQGAVKGNCEEGLWERKPPSTLPLQCLCWQSPKLVVGGRRTRGKAAPADVMPLVPLQAEVTSQRSVQQNRSLGRACLLSVHYCKREKTLSSPGLWQTPRSLMLCLAKIGFLGFLSCP